MALIREELHSEVEKSADEIHERRQATREELHSEVEKSADEIHERRQAIRRFRVGVLAAAMHQRGGELVLKDLYHDFKSMKPSIHRECDDPRTIDLTAFTYAQQRLPDEITTASSLYVKKEVEELASLTGLRQLSSRMKRRAMYDQGNGNLLSIARDPDTDVLDTASCVTSEGIEARKMKSKFDGKAVPPIPRGLDFSQDTAQRNQYLARIANILNVDLRKLIWANKALDYRLPFLLENIASHDLDTLRIEFDSQFSKTDASLKAREWRKRIESELKKYGDRPIAIISSDTHSVINCLTGFARDNNRRLLEIASSDPSIPIVPTNNPSLCYHLIRSLCKNPENKGLLEEKIAYEKELGIKLIKDEFKTGVDVHVIDLERILKENPPKIDPRIKFNLDKLKQKGLIILNMDYSFGRQGTHSMRELCETFKNRIESISITGKAGLTTIEPEAGRFDIMLPTYVLPQIEYGLYDFPNGNQLQTEDFDNLIRGIKVPGKNGQLRNLRIHNSGPVLTVPCVAMQSDILLKYYIDRDNTIGVEMEAVPYLDAIIKEHRRGYLRKDLMINVGYWASDVPLDPEESLAEDHMNWGFLPSYALNLAILGKVLNK
jgi:hypothetical protein